MPCSAVNLFLSINNIEEAILLVLEALINVNQRSVVLHQMFTIGQKDHALVLISVELQLLPDNGQNFTHLE